MRLAIRAAAYHRLAAQGERTLVAERPLTATDRRRSWRDLGRRWLRGGRTPGWHVPLWRCPPEAASRCERPKPATVGRFPATSRGPRPRLMRSDPVVARQGSVACGDAGVVHQDIGRQAPGMSDVPRRRRDDTKGRAAGGGIRGARAAAQPRENPDADWGCKPKPSKFLDWKVRKRTHLLYPRRRTRKRLTGGGRGIQTLVSCWSARGVATPFRRADRPTDHGRTSWASLAWVSA